MTNQSTEVLHPTCSKSRSQFRCRETYSLLYDYIICIYGFTHSSYVYAMCICIFIYNNINSPNNNANNNDASDHTKLNYIVFPLKNRSTTSGICFRHFRSFRKKARPASSVSDWWQTQEGQNSAMAVDGSGWWINGTSLGNWLMDVNGC